MRRFLSGWALCTDQDGILKTGTLREADPIEQALPYGSLGMFREKATLKRKEQHDEIISAHHSRRSGYHLW